MTNSNRKGKEGERDACKLIYLHTGWNAKRKGRQHKGDSDIEGVPGWSVEVKNHASPTLADIRGWWAQCVRQAQQKDRPVLIYKRQPGKWRAVWGLIRDEPDCPLTYDYTAEGSIEAWALVAREGV